MNKNQVCFLPVWRRTDHLLVLLHGHDCQLECRLITIARILARFLDHSGPPSFSKRNFILILKCSACIGLDGYYFSNKDIIQIFNIIFIVGSLAVCLISVDFNYFRLQNSAHFVHLNFVGTFSKGSCFDRYTDPNWFSISFTLCFIGIFSVGLIDFHWALLTAWWHYLVPPQASFTKAKHFGYRGAQRGQYFSQLSS